MLPTRKQVILDSCASQYREKLTELLGRIRTPDGANLLQRAIAFIEEQLVELSDECPTELIKNYRDAARHCIKLLARHRDMSDESDRHADTIGADRIYKAFAVEQAESRWESDTLRLTLFLVLLQGEPDSPDIEILLAGIDKTKIFENHQLPATPLRRLQFYSHFLRELSPFDSKMAAIGAIVERISSQLVVAALDPSTYTLTKEESDAIEQKVQESRPKERELSPTEALKKEVTRISTRIGSSIRHIHRPLVHYVPHLCEARDFLAFLKHEDKETSDWVAVHALTSTFALPLLGIPTNRQVHSRVTLVGSGLQIAAPRLRKRKADAESRPEYEVVADELILPLPKKLARTTGRLREAGSELQEKANRAFNSVARKSMNQFGYGFRLNALHRLLPLHLGNGTTVDATLLHLLGLTEIERRDAGIHYFSPSIDRIIKVYQDGVAKLAQELDLGSWLDEGWTDTPEQPGCFGASARPSSAALRNLVTFLRTHAENTRGNRPLPVRIAAYNAQAALVTVLFLASTGGRPVGEVFPTNTAWDAGNRVMLLSEKDSLLYRSTRLLFGPELLVAEVEDLHKRRANLEVQYGRRFNPEFAVTLLAADGTELPPTIANLRAMIPGFSELWPWPNDILRHHFRSRLWELGTEAWALDAAMGHFPKSKTPDTSLATRPIGESVIPVLSHVDTLLNEIGF